MRLNLSADEVLSTTRAVRKRLDFDRPVPRHLIEECVDLATQAPTGRNRQRWHFLVVTDEPGAPRWRSFFRKAVTRHAGHPLSEHDLRRMNAYPGSRPRTIEARVPLRQRPPGAGLSSFPPSRVAPTTRRSSEQAVTWGSILPAVWSFMLAARERGARYRLDDRAGPAGTRTGRRARRPYDKVMLSALIPLAFTIGTGSGRPNACRARSCTGTAGNREPHGPDRAQNVLKVDSWWAPTPHDVP